MELRTFRSRLNQLPLDLKCELAELPLQKGMRPGSRREKAIELLKKYKIQYTELGTGTNRFIVKYEGYAMKIALDKEGVADNRQEWVMSGPLKEGVAKAYEISGGGHLLMAEYAGAFSSNSEFVSYRSQILPILARWNAEGFLLGDVGMDKINYANWGLLPTGKAVCIDYAYIFPANMDIFECLCGCKSMRMNAEFTAYFCNNCNKKYEDRDIRVRISNEDRQKLFSSTEGLRMTEVLEQLPVDDKYIVKPELTNPDVISDEEVALRLSKLDINGEYISGNWYR